MILQSENSSKIQVTRFSSHFEREPLMKPFGFKGNMISNAWQVAVMLESDEGIKKIGLSTQSVLWSDPSVFVEHSEDDGNALMYSITQYALKLIKDTSYKDPIELLENIFEDVFSYAKRRTGHNNLKKTFVLNALVGLDNAAWLLYATKNGVNTFDEMIPSIYRKGLPEKHTKVVSIPVVGYGTPIEDIIQMTKEGFFVMKIKIGSPGTQSEMLEKDKEYLKAIHEAIGNLEIPHLPNGKIPYYFDANGRYENKDIMMRFLDYADQIGAIDQIAVLEEPFNDNYQENVKDITERGPRVAADESSHTDKDAQLRIEQGYNMIALKAIAKTLSMTLKIANLAFENKIPCFCADLTVNPILVDWNKCIAARLPSFSGFNLGLQETNGWQNYKNWGEMCTYHPLPNASWTKTRNGVYETDESFFEESGGIFHASPHYEEIFQL